MSHVTEVFKNEIQQRIDQKTKPIGALGKLEEVALQLAVLQSGDEVCKKIELVKPAMLVFAADHGIAEQGISIAPSSVTEQMVLNFLKGGAAINCFCRTNDIELHVIDAGIVNVIDSKHVESLHHARTYFHQQRIGCGTVDFSQSPAMTKEMVQLGLKLGESIVEKVIEQGTNIILLGEMGIGNTSAASAIFSAFGESTIEDSVGYGTGISATQYEKKLSLIRHAVARCINEEGKDPYGILAQLGGFEIVQMVGAVLAAAKANIAIVVDGFIVTVAVFVADKIDHTIRDKLVFSHCSEEKAHKDLLRYFGTTALLNLNLRLGEGTGAALAYPLIQSAVSFYNDMATFEQAGVSV